MAGSCDPSEVEDTWARRDLPVLSAIVSALEDQADVSAAQVARVTGIPGEDVVKAFRALEGTYTRVEAILGEGPGSVFVTRVTPAARLAAGQWPTAGTVVEKIAAALEHAADREPGRQRSDELRSVADGLRGEAQAIAVSVIEEMLRPHLPRE
jgi:hypothetical protein